MSRSWRVPGIVVSVHDGDTATLDLDLGWFLTNRQPVRVAHLNAPELSTPEGVLARDAARAWLPVGTKVELVSTGLDKYGRSLGVITLPDGRDFGTLMLDAGFAVPYL